MKLANVAGRAVVLTTDDHGYDVAQASGGKFGPDLASVYANWRAFRAWVESTAPAVTVRVQRKDLDPPSPAPSQVVAIGLNYDAHAAEAGFEVPQNLPPTFTKFPSALTGAEATVVIPEGGHVDWEVELVVIMGQAAAGVSEDHAWDLVAGVSVGQDISERIIQMHGPAPQFSLGKSFPNFAPVGPYLVTVDELPDKDDLRLGCAIDGETVQDGTTRDMIFSVPQLIAKLSHIITLRPGDVIFTGTPAGVGVGRNPQRFLREGEELRTWIEGIGEIHQRFVSTTHSVPTDGEV